MLQAAAENRPELTNEATPRKSKKNCIVLFNTLDTKSHSMLPQKKQHNNDKQNEQEKNPLSNKPTTTWRDEL